MTEPEERGGGAGRASRAACEPRPATIEAWCAALVETRVLAEKMAPPPAPEVFAERPPPPRRIEAPGRPAALRVVARAPKAPRPGALRDPRRAAELCHAFFHHELQAAELMGWAVLAFPETPEAFRRGLLRIAEDELRHLRTFAAAIEGLGHRVGDFPVRDWFWARVPAVASPAAFVALLGVGLEGGNLDHSTRWAEHLTSAGHADIAEAVARIGDEEIPHVRFALRWLEHFVGEASFERWLSLLPPPLSPVLFRGRPLDRARRRRAGLDEAWLDALERWEPPVPVTTPRPRERP